MATTHTTSSSILLGLRYLSTSLLIMLSLICSSNVKAYALSPEESKLTNYYSVPVTTLLTSSICSPFETGDEEERSMKVFRRHEPSSAPTLREIISTDKARVNSIHSRLRPKSSTNDFQDNSESKVTLPASLALSAFNYIVTVGLGTPKRDLAMVFDTGSDLFWTQCKPCAQHCYKQKQPIFDPSKSASYSNVSCSSALCSQLSNRNPSCEAATCLYQYGYGDGSTTVGYYAKEKITLSPSQSLSNFIIGCGQNNTGLYGDVAGIMGLGQESLSIVSQSASKFGKHFSYCLPSPTACYGRLTFGKTTPSTNLKYTPIFTHPNEPTFYFVDMTGISVGGRKLLIKPSVFKQSGTLVDSGTAVTNVPPAAYAAMVSALRKMMKKYPLAKSDSGSDLCYDLRKYSSVTIPKISFEFAGNVEVDILPSGILQGDKTSEVCFNMIPNADPKDAAIFGNLQQQTLELVYDVEGRKLGFGQGGCR